MLEGLTSGCLHHLHIRNHLGWLNLLTRLSVLLILHGLMYLLYDLLFEHIDIRWILHVIDQDVELGFADTSIL